MWLSSFTRDSEVFSLRPKWGGEQRTQSASNQDIRGRKLPVLLRFTCFIHAWLLVNYVNYVSVDMHRHMPIWIHFYMLMRSY